MPLPARKGCLIPSGTLTVNSRLVAHTRLLRAKLLASQLVPPEAGGTEKSLFSNLSNCYASISNLLIYLTSPPETGGTGIVKQPTKHGNKQEILNKPFMHKTNVKTIHVQKIKSVVLKPTEDLAWALFDASPFKLLQVTWLGPIVRRQSHTEQKYIYKCTGTTNSNCSEPSNQI